MSTQMSIFIYALAPSAETFSTVVFPDTMSCTVDRMDDQSSKTVKGTFSLSQ